MRSVDSQGRLKSQLVFAVSKIAALTEVKEMLNSSLKVILHIDKNHSLNHVEIENIYFNFKS